MITGQRAWRSAIRNVWNSLRRGNKGSRPRVRRHSSCGWGCNTAAEVMEPRALLSGPSMGQGISVTMGTGTGSAHGQHVVTDSSGNVYSMMLYAGSGNINPGSGDVGGTPYVLTSSSNNAIAKYDSTLNLQWVFAPDQNPANSTLSWSGRAMAVGAVSGDLYVTGTMSLGSAGGTVALPTAQGSVSVSIPSGGESFIARLDKGTGNVVWFAGITGAQIGSLVTYSTGTGDGVYVAGSVISSATGGPAATMQFSYVYGPGTGGVPVSFTVPSFTNGVYDWNTGTYDPPAAEYFLKLDGNGNAQWCDHFMPNDVTNKQGVTSTGQLVDALPGSGGPGGMRDHKLAVDSAGNLYWTGGLMGSVNADPNPNGPADIITNSHGAGDFVMEKIDPNGNLVWLNHNPSAQMGAVWIYGTGIAVDASGNVDVSVAGGYEISATKTGKTTTVVSAYLLQFDTNDKLKWYQTSIANGSTGGADAPIRNFDIDAAGNIYAATATASGSPPPALDKYSASGSLLWSITDGTTGTRYILTAYDVSIDASGNIWWTGFAPSGGTYSQVNVSPTSTPYNLPVDPAPGPDNLLLVEWTQPGGFAAAAKLTGRHKH